MERYVVLAGGGVKGVALAGCLAAAQDKDIKFIGYGGTSAGSIVALLGSVGYNGWEIRELMFNKSFSSFLDDEGRELERLKSLAKFIFEDKWFKLPRVATKLYREKDLIGKLYRQSGLYRATNLEKFLKEKVKARYPHLSDGFKFKELVDAGAKPLKVVAADVVARKSLIFSDNRFGGEEEWSVIGAVRASISYPFVFRPVQMHNNYLADGGISSNLPVFLFERERKTNNLPVMAFDLIVPPIDSPPSDYKLFKFSEDMLMTTMESSDKLLQGLIPGLHYISVTVPLGIDTLKFSLSKDEQASLFQAGYDAAKKYLEKDVKHWFERGSNRIAELQSRQRVRPPMVENLLSVVAKDFESHTSATKVRCSIMLPTGGDTQIVVYQHGMSGQPDVDFEISLASGWSGAARSTRRVVAADLSQELWNLSSNERAKIPSDRKAALSIPLFDISSSIDGRIDADKDRVLGTLSIDTEKALNETGWGSTSATAGVSFDLNEVAKGRCRLWGEVFSRLLS